MEFRQQRRNEDGGPPVILVVHDVEEVRDGIESLLRTTGYAVLSGRNEADAIDQGRRRSPDLILLSLGGPGEALVAAARRVRAAVGLDAGVPIVIFCVETIQEGAEMALTDNVYLVRPDNFDQLRALLQRLLTRPV